MPVHHLPDDIIEARAIGAVEPALAVVADAHADLCAACRSVRADLEAIGGALLAESPEADLPDGFEERLLSRLGAPRRGHAPVDPVLPPSVVALTGPYDRLRWRFGGRGVEVVDLLPRPGRLPLRLVRLAPGTRIPLHDHAGPERAVVLTGGWTDAFGHFERGDVAWIPAEVRGHDQRIDDGSPCVALVLNDRPIVPRNPLLRVGARWLGV